MRSRELGWGGLLAASLIWRRVHALLAQRDVRSRRLDNVAWAEHPAGGGAAQPGWSPASARARRAHQAGVAVYVVLLSVLQVSTVRFGSTRLGFLSTCAYGSARSPLRLRSGSLVMLIILTAGYIAWGLIEHLWLLVRQTLRPARTQTRSVGLASGIGGHQPPRFLVLAPRIISRCRCRSGVPSLKRLDGWDDPGAEPGDKGSA